jgi:transposase
MTMRAIGIDVHREFCEVAIAEAGKVRAAGRIESRPEAIELFAQSLGAEDQVVLESTFGAARIAKLIEPHVARVVVCDPRRLASSGSRKTDKRDAKRLAELLASGFLDEVWAPDEQTRTLRRLVARRASLMRTRTRAKNEVHAALGRNLCPRPPMKDLFGKSGRRWLERIELPADEQLTVDGCLRQIDFHEAELAKLDRALAAHALGSAEVRRLLSVPGVNMQTAVAFMAAVGEIGRFGSARKLVAYLGLDPRVRQSGEGPPRHGRISKAGNSEARHMLGEAAWSVAMTPGPMKAFYERLRARRGAQIAATATARKLAALFWHLLVREEDYAFARPSMTRKKIRELELRCGAEPQRGRQHAGGPLRNPKLIAAERAVAAQAELGYRRLITDWKQQLPSEKGAGATEERASQRPSSGQAARQGSAPEPAL